MINSWICDNSSLTTDWTIIVNVGLEFWFKFYFGFAKKINYTQNNSNSTQYSLIWVQLVV